ncbi:MAG: class I SAM-dependent methyltransferase, partial [Fulvivirga sp.]|uniref:class I SAM-dependent methyltransferase n=1 Tax=Fulvivirga sp. TaxID=1931237 RepID=UPI0032EF0A7F
MIKNLLKKIINSNNIEQQTNSSYWSRHNVTSHKKFSSIDESLNYLQWRNDQYYNYEKYMPTHSFDDKRILDYGCGPGHDLVGFGVNSKPKELIGIDVSPVSLSEAGHRINLHNINAELILLDENENNLPFEDHSFDYVHSSGVLHHVQDPVSVLKEIKRVLKIDGKIRMMLYNYDSIWLHLYVAYHRNIIQGLYPDKDIREQFSHSTDGEDCPISNVYKYHEWI